MPYDYEDRVILERIDDRLCSLEDQIWALTAQVQRVADALEVLAVVCAHQAGVRTDTPLGVRVAKMRRAANG